MTNKPQMYKIHIQGKLSDRWSDWLDGLTIEAQSDEETILSGILPDQSALLGVLGKIHALNLKITLVKRGLTGEIISNP